MASDVPVTPYPPFSGEGGVCQKCNEGPMLMDYQPACTRWAGQGQLLFAYDCPEWMLRKCAQCGFERPEMCGDAPTERSHWEKLYGDVGAAPCADA